MLHELCGKYGHIVTDSWNMFDEFFMTSNTQPIASEYQHTKSNKHESSTSHSQAMTMIATTHQLYANTQEYSLPSELKFQV